MQYKNISDENLTVEIALEVKLVSPGETVLTAPKFANSLVESGKLQPQIQKKNRATKKAVTTEEN